jgi:uncharacterized protein (DUF305 family)
MSFRSAVAFGVAVLVAGTGCAARQVAGTPSAGGDDHAHMHGASAPIVIPPGAIYTAADVQFMQGMIAHHAQAVFMTSLAESRGAGPRVLFLSRKIDQSQVPEIRLMQEWLAANNQFVPDTGSHRSMQMPGMLTAQQLANLQKARGKEFDRQFLQLMIQHHEGALKMVADLLASRGAAQDPDVAGLASDIDVTQTAEIDLMLRMLADL